MKRFLAACLTLLLAVSCGNYRNIDITGVKVEGYRVTSMRTANITLSITVDNPSSAKFEVTDLTGIIHKKEQTLATGVCHDALNVPPKQVSDIQCVIDVKLDKSLNLIEAGLELANMNIDDYAVDLSATVHKGMLSKKLKQKNLPLRMFIEK